MTLPAAAEQLLRREGNVMGAVRVLREAEGLDAPAARARVDAWLSAQPVLKEQLEVRSREARGGFWVLGVMLLAGIAAALLFFRR